MVTEQAADGTQSPRGRDSIEDREGLCFPGPFVLRATCTGRAEPWLLFFCPLVSPPHPLSFPPCLAPPLFLPHKPLSRKGEHIFILRSQACKYPFFSGL